MNRSYLLGEVFEQWHISPSVHICALELANVFVFGLFRVFVQCSEKSLVQDEVLVALLIMNFDIRIIWVDA